MVVVAAMPGLVFGADQTKELGAGGGLGETEHSSSSTKSSFQQVV